MFVTINILSMYIVNIVFIKRNNILLILNSEQTVIRVFPR